VAVITALAMMRTAELRRLPMTPRGPDRSGPDSSTYSACQTSGSPLSCSAHRTMSYNFAVVFPLFVEKGLHGGDGTYALVYSASAQAASSGRCSSPGVPPSVSGPLRSVQRPRAACLCSQRPSVALAYLVATLVGAASVAYMTATTAIAQIRTNRT